MWDTMSGIGFAASHREIHHSSRSWEETMKTERLEWFLLVAYFCILPLFAYLIRYGWILRVHAESVGGELVLKVPRPRVKRWETTRYLLAWIILFGAVTKFVYVFTIFGSISALELVSALTLSLLALLLIGSYWSSGEEAYVEFREHGIVCGAMFCPWEGIREWRWSDQAFTLRLKLRNCIMSYRLRPADKEAVQTELEKHLMGLYAAGRSPEPID